MKKINYLRSIKKWEKFNPDDESHSIRFLFTSYAILTDILEKKSKQEDDYSKSIAKHNFVVNLVTALETYLKHKIASRSDWVEEGYNKFMIEPVTINQAFNLFQKESVTRQFLVADSQSFQNISIIGDIFNTLTGKKFFEEIGKVKIKPIIATTQYVTFGHDFPQWKDEVGSIFKTRHSFIHEGELSNLTDKQVERYFLVMLLLISTIEAYFKREDNGIFDDMLGGVLISIVNLVVEKINERKK